MPLNLAKLAKLGYNLPVKSVNIGELKNRLSTYLRYVREGEEVVIKDRNRPVARILPFEPRSLSEEEALLVASGKMKLPEKEMDWDEFFCLSKANVPREVALKALLESRGDR
ncbi:MAG TPA: type II toxin-antitoxin system prevent-host-death family antitoxin [Acidobacteriaceae bacterium]|jgi:prevent-host-death family protein|nr:type II toxin-antitoxin system prevent-host-death family antitoxin [Acidobacteriaceae bacterium]